MSDFIELLPQVKKRKKPHVGDIFAMKVKEDLYYYGKVIKTDISSKNPFLNGMNLVYIYDYRVSHLVIEELGQISNSVLLFPPVVTNNKGWYDGYFFTVGNIKPTQDELTLDYGFWDEIRKKYRSE